MQMQMTKRDKNLLIFLAVFVIVVGFGYWGIKPQIQAIGELDLKIEDAKALKDINDMKISMLPMVQGENEGLEKQAVKVRENFYPMMTADEIDKKFTGMALGYHLSVFSLDIAMPTGEFESEPYQYSKRFEEQEAHAEEGYVEEEGTTTDIESVDNYAETGYTDFYEDEPAVATGIYATGVSMRLQGERNDLQRFIDDLSAAKENHLIKSYKWEEGSNMVKDADGEYVMDQKIYLDISFDIYQCKQ
ncbi:MAG: hypothetical protein IKR68_10140 [Lachnospiraceae bacterium]|nr:hypothetical protein [Lachnospiraceae bacterium]